jgi:hypothetical protein
MICIMWFTFQTPVYWSDSVSKFFLCFSQYTAIILKVSVTETQCVFCDYVIFKYERNKIHTSKN